MFTSVQRTMIIIYNIDYSFILFRYNKNCTQVIKSHREANGDIKFIFRHIVIDNGDVHTR